jgi:hypothetical protein
MSAIRPCGLCAFFFAVLRAAMTSRKRRADDEVEGLRLALTASNNRVLELESQLEILQTQNAALKLLQATMQEDLNDVYLSLVAKDRALEEALEPNPLTATQVLGQLDQLAELASDGLCAFSSDPLRAARPDLEKLDQYTNPLFVELAITVGEKEFVGAAATTAELEGDSCQMFVRFVRETLSRAQSKLRARRDAANPRTRQVDPGMAAQACAWRRNRADAMILQYAVEFVNPRFVSPASYIIGLNVRCMTKSALATDLLGRYLPGGSSSSTFQRHLTELVEAMDDSKLDIPIAATAIFGYDNNSDNYINTHA